MKLENSADSQNGASLSSATTTDQVPSVELHRWHLPRLEFGELRRYGVLGAFIALFIVFSILRPDSFPTKSNVLTILNLSSISIIVAVGATVPLLMNDFDLSFAGMMSLAGGVGAVLLSRHHLDPWMIFFVVVALGAFVGTANGIAVAYFNGSSFIITLGCGSIVSALELLVTNQETVFSGIPRSILDIGRSIWLGLMPGFVLAIVVALIVAFIIDFTVLGRQMRAIGGSSKASHISGVDVRRTRLIGFVISGIAGGLGGLVLMSISGAAYPDAGAPYLLPAFAGAFLGGTIFPRRRFSILGTVIAVVALEMITQGLDQLNQPGWSITLLNGSILVAAILLSTLRAGEKLRRAEA